MKNYKRKRLMGRWFLFIVLALLVFAGYEIHQPKGLDAQEPGKKVKFWVSPMNPALHSDKPMKDGMGMDYVPVYDESSPTPPSEVPIVDGLGEVNLTTYQQNLINVQFAAAEKVPLVHTIHTTGRLGGGGADFANLATEFAAGREDRSQGRYVVADIYALDIPMVKTGQRAWISPMTDPGARVAGQVTAIYPYDATQSRVVRVQIRPLGPLPREIFANVDIEAVTEPRVAVPPTAVEDTGTRRYVFVSMGNGKIVPRIVTVGFHGDDAWEITSGLKPGEKVVDGAVFMIDADSKIQSASSVNQ